MSEASLVSQTEFPQHATDMANKIQNISHLVAIDRISGRQFGEILMHWYPERVLLQVGLVGTFLALIVFGTIWISLCHLYRAGTLHVTGHNRYMIGSSTCQYFGILLMAATPEEEALPSITWCPHCVFVLIQCVLTTFGIYLEMAMLRERFLFIARPLHYNKYNQLDQSWFVLGAGAVLSALPLLVMFALPRQFRVIYLSWTLFGALMAGLATNLIFMSVICRIGWRHIEWDIQTYIAREVSRMKNPSRGLYQINNVKVHPELTPSHSKVTTPSEVVSPDPGRLNHTIVQIAQSKPSGGVKLLPLDGDAEDPKEDNVPSGDHLRISIGNQNIIIHSKDTVYETPPGGGNNKPKMPEVVTGSGENERFSCAIKSRGITSPDYSMNKSSTSSTPLSSTFSGTYNSDECFDPELPLNARIYVIRVNRSKQIGSDDWITDKKQLNVITETSRDYLAIGLKRKSILAAKAATYVILYVLKYILVAAATGNYLTLTRWSLQATAISSALMWSIFGSLQLIWLCYTDKDIKHALNDVWRNRKCCRPTKIRPISEDRVTIDVIS